ncbi:MAG: hypothetical protein EBT00_17075, partial [Proteobacteria bacterium]|nr:hypothetical protein [Pseudomonadota bacterium]
HHDRQTDHDRISVGDVSPPGGSWVLRPAWIGLPGRWVAGSLTMCVTWWGMGVWLYWGHPPRYDEFYYTFWARHWLDFDLDYLARNWPGTMIRPYLYQLFLAVIGAPFPSMLDQTFESRLYIGLIQLVVYLGSVLRLAQHAQMVHGRKIGVALLFGLLAMPFPVFTQVEVLSESLGLSIFCWFVIAATQVVGSVRGARALAKFALVTFIAMGLVLVRSGFVPVALTTIAWSGIGVALMAARRPLGALVRVTGYIILLAVPMVVLALPQAYLMINHQKDVPNDPQLWGVGASQIIWSVSMAKYSTSVVQCKDGPVGFEYPMPLLSGLNAAGFPQPGAMSLGSAIWWFVLHPSIGLVHLFEAINHDFPTTYVTTFNPIVSIGFNVLGLMVASTGIVTLVRSAWAVRKDVAAFSFVRADRTGTSLVVLVVATIWGMTAVTAVETRFGIIPWCGLSVAAAYGAIT